MKKLFTLFLVLATTFVLVGCGSSGGSSSGGDDLISLLANKPLEFNFDISLSDSMAANLRATSFNINDLTDSMSATIYKSDKGVRNNSIKYLITKNNFKPNGDFGFKVTLSLKADNEVLKELLLSNFYEIDVQNNNKTILRAFTGISETDKLNALVSNEELLQSINPTSTAKAALFEELKKNEPEKVGNYDDFITLFLKTNKLEDAITDLTTKITNVITENKTLYDEQGNLSKDFSTHFFETFETYVDKVQLYQISGDIDFYVPEGTENGTMLYSVRALRKISENTWEPVIDDLATSLVWVGGDKYQITVKAGTYKLCLTKPEDDFKTLPSKSYLYKSEVEITVPKPDSVTENNPIGNGFNYKIIYQPR